MRPSNPSHRPWTEKEIADLIRLYGDGMTHPWIAAHLHRGGMSVKHKIRELIAAKVLTLRRNGSNKLVTEGKALNEQYHNRDSGAFSIAMLAAGLSYGRSPPRPVIDGEGR